MKKRLLSVLLLVCMVLTLLPTAAFAEDVQAEHTHCFCGGSVNAGDHTSHDDAVTYKACTKANYLRQIFWIDNVDVAYAYLENDMTLDGSFSIIDGKTLYLCLNGHTLNLGEYTILVGSHGAKLYLCDCSAEKTGTVSGGSNRCVSVSDAADYEATFNMYGARIGISTGLCVFSTESKTNYSEYFISDDARRHVEYNADKKLELVEGAAHVHSGGTATCTQKAVCSTCGREYGDLAAHDFTAQVAGEQYLTSAASCTNAAVYYKSCTVCGLSSKGMDGEATFTSGNILGHDWGAWTSNGDGTHTRTCKRDTSHTETESCTGGTADCTNKAICTVCGGEYGDLASHNFTAETVGGKYLKSAADCEHAAVYAGWSTRELPFTDVGRGDWFFDDVRYVYETGLMNGVTATRFAPYASTTRGMIVTILYRMEGQPSVSRDCPFTDVASGSYYERAITWAAANGIVTGHSSTIFAPDANITREQLAAILYRYAFYKGLDVSAGENTNILSYEDFASLSEYAIPAMQWACGAGILYGFGGSLLPDAPANRLQAAAILHRFCVNILN